MLAVSKKISTHYVFIDNSFRITIVLAAVKMSYGGNFDFDYFSA